MVNFDEIFDSIKSGFEDLAKTTLSDLNDVAVEDAYVFLTKTKNDLMNWTEQLAEKKINQTEFELNVRGQKELAECVLLKKAGLAEIEVDKFQTGIMNIIINTVLKLI